MYINVLIITFYYQRLRISIFIIVIFNITLNANEERISTL